MQPSRIMTSVALTAATIVSHSSATVEEEFRLAPSTLDSGDNFGRSSSAFGNLSIFGATGDDDNGADAGKAFIFDLTDGTLKATLTASDGAAGDGFGSSVAIGGSGTSIALVGAPGDDNGKGSAYLYNLSTLSSPTLIGKIVASDGALGDSFGRSVALDGNTYAVIGAPNDDDNGTNSGSVYVFDITSLTSTPTQVVKLTASDGAANEVFGSSVAVDSGTVLAGALTDDNGTDSGAVYVFTLPSGTEVSKIIPSDNAANDSFGVPSFVGGQAVAIDLPFAVVGAPLSDDQGTNSGSAYLFDLSSPSSPIQRAHFAPTGLVNRGEFGAAVGIVGDRVIGSALGDSSTITNPGAIFLYDISNPFSVVQIATMVPSTSVGDDLFGVSADIGAESNSNVVGSAVLEDGTGIAFTFLANPSCPGDVNNDGVTSNADTTMVIANLGAGMLGDPDTPGDADGNGVTNTADITFVVNNLGCDLN